MYDSVAYFSCIFLPPKLWDYFLRLFNANYFLVLSMSTILYNLPKLSFENFFGGNRPLNVAKVEPVQLHSGYEVKLNECGSERPKC